MANIKLSKNELLKEKARTEQKLKDIEAALRLMSGYETIPHTTNSESSSKAHNPVDASILGKIRDVIATQTETFTAKDIIGLVSDKYGTDVNRITASNALSRLKDANEISIQRVGKGRRATLYVKQEVKQE